MFRQNDMKNEYELITEIDILDTDLSSDQVNLSKKQRHTRQFNIYFIQIFDLKDAFLSHDNMQLTISDEQHNRSIDGE